MVRGGQRVLEDQIRGQATRHLDRRSVPVDLIERWFDVFGRDVLIHPHSFPFLYVVLLENVLEGVD